MPARPAEDSGTGQRGRHQAGRAAATSAPGLKDTGSTSATAGAYPPASPSSTRRPPEHADPSRKPMRSRNVTALDEHDVTAAPDRRFGAWTGARSNEYWFEPIIRFCVRMTG